jgi:hypothetical protein
MRVDTMKYEVMDDLDSAMRAKQATAKELAKRSGYSISTIEHARTGRAVYRRTAAEIREALHRFAFRYIHPNHHQLRRLSV